MAASSSSSTITYTSAARGNALLETSMGSITIELYWKQVPKTCQNFYELCRTGYYNNVPFHRIAKDFVIQGGDPTGTGRFGSSIYGEIFDDELTPSLRHTGAGVVSMANSGSNTNGSQFFITLAPLPLLDGKHTIFGRVLHGMSVVQRLSLVATDTSDRPIEPILILRTYVISSDTNESNTKSS